MTPGDARTQRRLLLAALATLEDRDRVDGLPRDGTSDAEAFLAVARHHRLTPLLSALPADGLGARLAEACRRDRLVTVARNLLMGPVAEACLGALDAAGVPAIVLPPINPLAQIVGTERIDGSQGAFKISILWRRIRCKLRQIQ